MDVVAHEFLHREISDRIGFWRMETQVPAWFNEGLAMQVDYRVKYELDNQAPSEMNIAGVRELESVNQFNQGNDAQVTQHYALAKAEVAAWLAKVGHHNLYSRFERIRNGAPFDHAIKQFQAIICAGMHAPCR